MFGLFKSADRKEKEKELKAAKKQAHKQEFEDMKANARRVRKFKATDNFYPVLFDEIDSQIKLQLNKYEAVVFDYDQLLGFEVKEQFSSHDPLKVIRLSLEVAVDGAKAGGYRVEFLEKEMKSTDFKYSVKQDYLNKVIVKFNEIIEA